LLIPGLSEGLLKGGGSVIGYEEQLPKGEKKEKRSGLRIGGKQGHLEAT